MFCACVCLQFSICVRAFALLQVKNMIVYVEKKVLEDPAISGDKNFGAISKNFCTFREGVKSSHHCCPSIVIVSLQLLLLLLLFPDLDDISNVVDFIICLGGDGTLLYASSLFQVFACLFLLRTRLLGTLEPKTPFTPSLQLSHPVVPVFLVGERPSSYGVPPGFAGLSDAFQI